MLTHALSLAAPAAHGGSLFTPPANNRTSKLVTGGGGVETGYWTYTHNVANQLTGWKKWSAPAPAGGTELRSATLTYDANGNRTSQVIGGQVHDGGDLTPANIENGTTTYTWDLQNRLIGVAMPSGRTLKKRRCVE